jgi:ribosome maturation protein SDO1
VLKLGEVQISEKERAKQHDECFHEIATIVVEKCVDANTNRALTVAMVERAMKQIQIRVLPNKSAKQQVRTRIASVHNQWG